MIYTTGYGAGWSVPALQSECTRLGATLVDIRHAPYSKRAEWNGTTLAHTFGDGYVHLGTLGNRNYTGGPIELVAPKSGATSIKALLGVGPVVLLCGCKELQVCHRKVAAEYLTQKLDETTEELEAYAFDIAAACHAWEIGGTQGLGLWAAQQGIHDQYSRIVRRVRAMLHDDTDYSTRCTEAR